MDQTLETGSPQGFTLVELLVVIVILTLIAASLPIALGRLIPARRLLVATERLVTDVRWLQGHSTATGRAAQLETTVTGYELRVAGLPTRTVLLPPPLTIKLLSPSRHQSISLLQVYPEGTASGGYFEVSDGRREREVQVNVLTGKVRRVPRTPNGLKAVEKQSHTKFSGAPPCAFERAMMCCAPWRARPARGKGML